MSNLLKFTLLFLGLFAASFSAMAQADKDDDGRRQGYWFLGLNSGGAWQQSDIKARPGGGLGFYLGGNLFYRKTSPISLDLRFRYLYTATYGQDWKRTYVQASDVLGGNHFDNSFFGNGISATNNYRIGSGGLGYAFMNNHTDFHDLSLELRLNFENLRRKHRIWFSLYGGAGVGFYNTYFDQLDDRTSSINPTLYNYGDVDTTGSNGVVRNRAIAIRDGDYETNVSNGYNASLMLHAGFELGYWITPRFAMGIGHRVTWTLQDDFDGYLSSVRARNDIHHYANLFLHFDLYGGRARVRGNINGNANGNGNVIIDNNTTVVVTKPRIVFSFPNACPYSTQNSVVNIRLNITDVNNAANITFMVNGTRITDYRYNTTTGVLEATIALNQGSNNIIVQANNSGGTSSTTCSIIYTPTAVVTPPTVDITFPNNGMTTNSNSTNVNATITNISNNSQVVFTVNGTPTRNFTLSGSSFTANNVILTQGSNTITISATNNDGTASDSHVISYVQQVNPPVVVQNPPTVQIITPAGNPFTTNSSPTNVVAVTTNVNNTSQVTFTVNGQITRNFSFSNGRITANNVSLVQGNNNINITVTNADGSASDTRTIVYNVQQPVVVQNPPTVQIITPAGNPFTTNSTPTSIVAVTSNINNTNQISFTVNGQITRNFSFSNGRITANNVSLVQGNNNINITVTNADGSASDTRTIIYNVQQPVVVQNPPTVQIITPAGNPFTTNSTPTTIIAVTTNINNTNQVTFTVNGQINRNFSFSNGRITANNVSLVQGNNNINITVTNADGSASDTRTIIYNVQQPVVVQNPPTVQIITPAGNPFTTNSTPTTIVAVTTNINNTNQVTFTVNGQITRNFSFSNGRITANNVSLVQGNNNINITVTNADGSASDTRTIIYNVQQPVIVQNPPTVQIITPAGNPFTTNSTPTSVVAVTTNINNTNQVTFTVNGQITRNFSFSNGRITANNVSLVQGNNNINITVTNADGSASDTRTIIYNVQQPVVVQNPPTVRFTIPNGNPYTASSTPIDITAVTTNINNVNQVRLSINGQAINNFGVRNNTVTASNIVLQTGNNTLNITVTNNDGTASDSKTIIYNAPTPVVQNPPTVRFTAPNGNPHTASSTPINITAVTTNIVRTNQVTFLVNGSLIRNFTLTNGTISANGIALQLGNNTLNITVTNEDGTASDSKTIIYNAPAPVVQNPPTVRFTAPNGNPHTASSTPIDITAATTNIDNVNQVRLSINGQAISNFGVRNNTVTASNIVLQAGNNTLNITVTNNDGTASDSKTIIYNAPAPVVQNPPTVRFTAPNGNPHTASSNPVNVAAATTNINNANQVRLTLNGQAVTNFSVRSNVVSATGLELQVGNNSLNITVTNEDGTASDSKTIIYNAPAPVINPPTVRFTAPNGNPYNTSTTPVNITAVTSGINNANQVTLTLNGQVIRSFTLSGNTVTANGIGLQAGNNTLNISVTNEGGSASDDKTIVYTVAAPQPPIVTITSPASSPFQSPTEQTNITATILHVPTAAGVTFRLNGRSNSNFTFRGTNFTANNVVLAQGNNDVEIIGTNQDGTASATTVIIYKQVAPPPTVNITTPNANPFNTTNSTENIVATVTNVASANDITFTVNGQQINNFSVRGNTFVANNVALNAGSNAIVITANNGVGSASDNTNIIYAAPVLPTVTINNPAANPSTVTTETVTIGADIRNVASSNDIVFTVNGQRINSFNFRNNSFTASNVTLQSGNNSIVITGTNPAGTASDNTVIIYNAPAPPPTTPEPIISNMNALQQQVRGATNTYVTANIQHVSSASGIVFTANGQSITNFTFSNGSFRANNVPVQPGINTYTITATNTAGSATMSATLNYSSGSTDGGGGNQNRTQPNNGTGNNTQNTGGRTSDDDDKKAADDRRAAADRAAADKAAADRAAADKAAADRAAADRAAADRRAADKAAADRAAADRAAADRAAADRAAADRRAADRAAADRAAADKAAADRAAADKAAADRAAADKAAADRRAADKAAADRAAADKAAADRRAADKAAADRAAADKAAADKAAADKSAADKKAKLEKDAEDDKKKGNKMGTGGGGQ